ncbi:MAG: hypothetical protein RL670_697 [Actinomycetota bacterium]
MITWAAILGWLAPLTIQERWLPTATLWVLAAMVALFALWKLGLRKAMVFLLLTAAPLAASGLHQSDPELVALTDGFGEVNARFEALQDSAAVKSNFGVETRVKIRLNGIATRSGYHHLSATGWASTREQQVFRAGESYRATLLFSPARSHSMAFQASMESKAIRVGKAPVWASLVTDLKARYLAETRGVNADAKALVTGMAIGDTTGLSEETKNQMVAVSLTHLVAVSGANCAIVVAATFVLLGRVVRRRWWRFAVTELVLIGYVYLTEGPPSVIRAAIMASVVILARTLGRRISALTSLSLAVLICLLIWPELVADFGFALSVAATLGLLVVAPELMRKLPVSWPTWLRAGVAVSASAQLLCTPILLQLQTGIPLYSIPANLLADPLVAPVTVLGLAALLLVGPAPALASTLVYLASLATNFIALEAAWFAGLPEATLPWLSGWLGAAAALALVLAAIAWANLPGSPWRKPLSAILVGVALIELSFAAAGYLRFVRWPTSDWFIASCDVGQGDATLIRSRGQVALIDVGREPDLVARCLGRLGIRHLDLLVLTHFDLDHVGGLKGALDHVSIGQALVTSFQDDRPAAAIVGRQLAEHGIAPVAVGVGVFGRLGDFSWRVISPHQGGAEAEDSNDGSVTMVFESPKSIIVTLADLGEKGQLRLSRESATWLPSDFYAKPLVLKVSHHGSADQYAEFIESLKPEIALISVGVGNGYGHPTERTLGILRRSGAEIERTDRMGSIAIGFDDSGQLVRSISGASLVTSNR